MRGLARLSSVPLRRSLSSLPSTVQCKAAVAYGQGQPLQVLVLLYSLHLVILVLLYSLHLVLAPGVDWIRGPGAPGVD